MTYEELREYVCRAGNLEPTAMGDMFVLVSQALRPELRNARNLARQLARYVRDEEIRRQYKP